MYTVCSQLKVKRTQYNIKLDDGFLLIDFEMLHIFLFKCAIFITSYIIYKHKPLDNRFIKHFTESTVKI